MPADEEIQKLMIRVSQLEEDIEELGNRLDALEKRIGEPAIPMPPPAPRAGLE